MNTLISRALITVGTSAALAVSAAGVAAAHVTVDAPGAKQGGYAVLTFKVPTESDTASTTKLSVRLPGLKSARTEPLPGWKAEVQRDGGGQVVGVTWTADPGVGVAPAQFQRFVLSVGPLPERDKLYFPAAQTYSDGKVVDWAEEKDEAEHPAPVVTLAAAGNGHGTTQNHAVPDASAAQAGGEQADGTDTTARWLGGIGLALGALGAALGLGSVLRGRRS